MTMSESNKRLLGIFSLAFAIGVLLNITLCHAPQPSTPPDTSPTPTLQVYTITPAATLKTLVAGEATTKTPTTTLVPTLVERLLTTPTSTQIPPTATTTPEPTVTPRPATPTAFVHRG